MNYTEDKIDDEVIEYFLKENLNQYIDGYDKLEYKYEYTDPNFGVSIDNKIPYPPDIPDLVRLHKLVRTRKSFTILECGLGYSTLIMADALFKNKNDYMKLEEKPNIRCNNLFEIHSVDSEEYWVEVIRKKINNSENIKDLIYIKYSECEIGKFNDRMCSYYKNMPDIVPDFIYLDGPSASSVKNNINSLSFQCLDRTIITGDLLLMEPTFVPGLFIIIDGRINNSYFLKNNFQRKYKYNRDYDNDISTFELIDDSLGIYNTKKLNFVNT